MKILVVAEHDNQELKSATLHALYAAKQFNGNTDVLVMGHSCSAVADKLTHFANIQTVLLVDDPVYEHQLAENSAALIAKIGKDYDTIVSAATTFGKNMLPRASALMDVALLSDVVEILAADTFVRPIYAGNILATVRSEDKIKMLTIRTTAFPIVKEDQQSQAKIEKINEVIPNSLSRFENQQLTQSARPELTSARIVISGGRGLKSAENFHMLETIADRLGAAIGASRAAVDAGFAPNDYQVGQTGKVVAPDLYIAIGISGAIQHLAGMKDSKVIVAINNDPDAPIFQIADYALVGDLFKILPELQQALDKVTSP